MGLEITNFFKLLNGVIVSPRKVFNKVLKGEEAGEILVVFCLTLLITFIKSFRFSKQTIQVFEVTWIDKFVSCLTVPHITWILINTIYFAFLSGLYLLGRSRFVGNQVRGFFLSFMSLAYGGLIAQCVFIGLKFIFSKDTLFILSYVVFAWIMVMSVLVIRECFRVSYIRSAVMFISCAIPTVFLAGLPGICPYLLWLYG